MLRQLAILVIAISFHTNLLAAEDPIPTQNTPAQVSEVNPPDFSVISAETGGIWYNPHHNGEGFFFHITEGTDISVLTMTWYSFDEQGQQMWLIGSGEYTKGANSVKVNLLRPQDTAFGREFIAEDINQPVWGNMTVVFNSCSEAIASFRSSEAFGSGEIPITKLADNAQTPCSTAPLPVTPPTYGDDTLTPGFGDAVITSFGDHKINGIKIASERLLTKDGFCFLIINSVNESSRAKAKMSISYDFFSAGEPVAVSGTTVNFINKRQGIESEMQLFQIGEEQAGCEIIDRVEINDFKVSFPQ